MKHLKRKNLLLLGNKLIGKIPDPCNAKESQSFLREKNRKSVNNQK